MPILEVKGQRFAIDTDTADVMRLRRPRRSVEIEGLASLNDAPPLYDALVHSHLTLERLSLVFSGPGTRRVKVAPLIVQSLAPAMNWAMPPSDDGRFNWLTVKVFSPE